MDTFKFKSNPNYNPYFSPRGKKLPRKVAKISDFQRQIMGYLKHMRLRTVEHLYRTCPNNILSIKYDRILPENDLTNSLTPDDRKYLDIDNMYIRITEINGTPIEHKYFFKSTGTSREHDELKDIWIPLAKDIVIISNSPLTNQRVVQYSKAEGEYLNSIERQTFPDELLTQLNTYQRFITEENMCISKYLYRRPL